MYSPPNIIKIKHYTFAGDYEEISINLSMFDYSEDTAIPHMIDEIMMHTGLNKNFRIKSTFEAQNACAVIIQNERYLLYNPNWMKELKTQSGTNWTVYSIMAHEIGHHLNGHTLDNIGSTPPKELEADEFSGFILCKIGSSLSEAQLAMKLKASEIGSSTHPPKHQRLNAVKNGYERADTQKKQIKTQRSVCSKCHDTGFYFEEHKCPKCNNQGITSFSSTCEYCKNGIIIYKDTCNKCNGASMTNCDNCNGHGVLRCASCNGSGSFGLCPSCNGYPKIHCPTCFGTGAVNYYGRIYPCPQCLGARSLTCLTCGGTGKFICANCSGQGVILCTNCFGTKITSCSSCNGSGQILYKRNCEHCNGTGNRKSKIKCSECNGTGIISKKYVCKH